MVNTRQNYGITLMALVITIIVLLILAGVAINAITSRKYNTKHRISSKKI